MLWMLCFRSFQNAMPPGEESSNPASQFFCIVLHPLVYLIYFSSSSWQLYHSNRDTHNGFMLSNVCTRCCSFHVSVFMKCVCCSSLFLSDSGFCVHTNIWFYLYIYFPFVMVLVNVTGTWSQKKFFWGRERLVTHWKHVVVFIHTHNTC